MYETVSAAVPVAPATRLQVVESNEPGTDRVVLKVTVPEGLVAPLVLVSVTVALQVEA